MQSNIHGVNATSGGLVKATIGAAVVAGAILTFVWLPAEYGIDPTGAGHVLGLTEMGEIKEQLHADADADAAAASTVTNNSSMAEINRKLDEIQQQLNTLQPVALATSQPSAPSEPSALWTDEVGYTLTPGEGIEVKLAMNEGAIAEFEWTANGSVVNHDTHGDGSGQSISYEKGRSVPEQTGALTAAFTGNHGWFWRNRTDDDVVVTLRTRGDYSALVLPKPEVKSPVPASRIERMAR